MCQTLVLLLISMITLCYHNPAHTAACPLTNRAQLSVMLFPHIGLTPAEVSRGPSFYPVYDAHTVSLQFAAETDAC